MANSCLDDDRREKSCALGVRIHLLLRAAHIFPLHHTFSFTRTSIYPFIMSHPGRKLANTHVNVGMMTSGGLAPCLSSSIASLAQAWISQLENSSISGLTIRLYIGGYKGLLTGDSIVVPPAEYERLASLHQVGGSPIGNSRVKVRTYE